MDKDGKFPHLSFLLTAYFWELGSIFLFYMQQVNVNKEDMRNFFVTKLAEKGFAPKGVDYSWWPNAIENIFASNKSPYLDSNSKYPSPSLYELMVFCIYSGAAFTETMGLTAASYDYFHCKLYDELYGQFYKLTNYIKNKRNSTFPEEVEEDYTNNAINLYEFLYQIVEEYFASIGVQDLPFERYYDGTLSDGFFIIMNKHQVFSDLDSIGANLYNVRRALRTGERSWPGISKEPILSFQLSNSIRINAHDLGNNLFFDINQRNVRHTHGNIGACPYCGGTYITKYFDGTAECNLCRRIFRYC